MGGRYGGDIRRKGSSSWRPAKFVLEAIGRAARPDLEAIGARVRRKRKAQPALPVPHGPQASPRPGPPANNPALP